MTIVKCPWCETQIADPTFSNCPNCGGTIALSEGDNPGPTPPSAPRILPPKFVKKTKYTNNVYTIIGIVFTIPFFWTVVFPIIGIILWKKGIKNANAELNPLMNGNSTHGTIVDVSENRSIQINGRSPFVVSFTFNANGQTMNGSMGNLFDASSKLKKPGDKIWVVYMLDDPEQSSIWPPLS